MVTAFVLLDGSSASRTPFRACSRQVGRETIGTTEVRFVDVTSVARGFT